LSRFWYPVWFRFAVIGFLAAMAEFIWGSPAGYLVALLGLLILIGFHLYYLRRVDSWLQAEPESLEHTEDLPEGYGAWVTVFAELRRSRRRENKRRGEVAETLNRFIEASSALPDGIIILDQGDRIEWCNPSACRHFGIDLARDQGYLIANLVRQPLFTEYLVRADFREPLVLTDPTGKLTLSVQMLPFQETRRIVLSRDISPFVKVETMRRDFIANVSHELRTPLTVVGGFLEQMIEQPDIPAEMRQRFETLMLEQTRRMQRLIEDLLTLSKLETQATPAREEDIHVQPLLETVASETRALSNGKHQILLDTFPAQLRGASDELRSVFSNLASNAVRYTPSGGTIRISFAPHPEGAQYSVTDTGPGIAPEHLPRLTERFYRVDKSRSRETGGTGLGLAIVKHVLARHGGRLEIDSELGQGSTFRAILPAQRLTVQG
jgi:two-component system phosphate regulon sensor histidine kinase PhoR